MAINPAAAINGASLVDTIQRQAGVKETARQAEIRSTFNRTVAGAPKLTANKSDGATSTTGVDTKTASSVFNPTQARAVTPAERAQKTIATKNATVGTRINVKA